MPGSGCRTEAFNDAESVQQTISNDEAYPVPSVKRRAHNAKSGWLTAVPEESAEAFSEAKGQKNDNTRNLTFVPNNERVWVVGIRVNSPDTGGADIPAEQVHLHDKNVAHYYYLTFVPADRNDDDNNPSIFVLEKPNSNKKIRMKLIGASSFHSAQVAYSLQGTSETTEAAENDSNSQNLEKTSLKERIPETVLTEENPGETTEELAEEGEDATTEANVETVAEDTKENEKIKTETVRAVRFGLNDSFHTFTLDQLPERQQNVYRKIFAEVFGDSS